ncbi:MAG: transcription antitermination protein RfaH [Alphaproteobacteria bacterium]|nr:MAG: transcription antitermination protein RfaH [Alphaproteobacteria bacterium]
MTRWHAAYTQIHAEARAAQELRNQGFHVFLPLCRRLRRHARRTEAVLRPLFPRYLFVALDIERQGWRSINGTRGILHLICQGDRPVAVPIGVVEGLRARADAAGAVPLDALAVLERGRPLQVTAGPFTGHTGRFESLTSDQRVVLLLEVLGRPLAVAVPLLHVDAA